MLKQLGYQHRGFTVGYTDEYQARWSYALNIKDKSMEDLYNDMHTRAKRSIKKYQKYPLEAKFLELLDKKATLSAVFALTLSFAFYD